MNRVKFYGSIVAGVIAIAGAYVADGAVDEYRALLKEKAEEKREAAVEAIKQASCEDALNRAQAMIICMAGEIVPLCVTSPADIAQLRRDNSFLQETCGIGPQLPRPPQEQPSMRFRRVDP